MFGILGAAFMAVLVCFVLWLFYAIVRMAVRDGMRDALRADEADRIRAQHGLGRERSPNQSS